MRSQERPEAQAEAHELRKRAFGAVNRGMPAQAMAEADAVMAAHAGAGPAGEPYLTARFWRAIALGHLGQHAAAAGEFGRLLDEVAPLLGDNHVTVVMGRVQRAGQLNVLGRYDEAEAESRTAIKQAGKIWPPDSRDRHRVTATAMLVSVLNGRGLHVQAEATARSAIRGAKGAMWVTAHTLVPLRMALAMSLNGQQRYQEAGRVLKDLQAGHPGWDVTVQLELTKVELGLGIPGEAEARAWKTVSEAERIHGPAHYATLRAGTLLGAAIARQGRCDEARPLLQANAEAWLEHFGEEHPRTIEAFRELA